MVASIALGVPAAAYLAILGYIYVNQRSLLYAPDMARPVLGDLTALGLREVALTTPDGLRLLAWFRLPAQGQPVLVYFHGNGGSIAGRRDRARRFAQAGLGLLMVEYRGYGGNPGSPSESGLYLDAEAAVNFLGKHGFGPSRLVLYGESLGTGVAVHVAAQWPVRAVVLESPYTSVAAAAQYHYPYIPAALLVWDRFDSLASIGAVKSPLLVLSGNRDTIIPPRFSHALFDAANQPKQLFVAPEATHLDLDHYGALDATLAFIERHARNSD